MNSLCVDLHADSQALVDFAQQAQDVISGVVAGDLDRTQTRTPTEVAHLLERLWSCDQSIDQLVARAQGTVTHLRDQIVPELVRALRHRTGWIDDPQKNERIAGTVSSLTLAGFVASAFPYVGPMWFKMTHASHVLGESINTALGVGPGVLHHVFNTCGHLGVFFGASLVAMFGSYATALGWGALKSGVGRVRRSWGHTSLDGVAAYAHDVQDALQGDINRSIGAVRTLYEVVSRFDDRCWEARDLASEQADLEQREIDARRGLPSGKTAAIAWELGADVNKQLLQLLLAQQTLLMLFATQLQPPDTTSARDRFLRSAHAAGPQSAIRALDDLHHYLAGKGSPEDLGIVRSSIGLLQGLAKIAVFCVTTGRRPDQGIADAIKGFLGLINFDREGGHGPSFEQLGRMVIAAEEKDRWRRAGLVVPNVALFAFKKVYFMIESQRLALARGEMGPEFLALESARNAGVTKEWSVTSREIFKLGSQATVGAARKLLVDIPLKFSARAEARLPLLRSWKVAQRMLNGWIYLREKPLKAHLTELASHLPDGDTLEGMSLNALKHHVLRRLILYYSRDRAVSTGELDKLFTYWETRETLERLESYKRSVAYDAEVSQLPGGVRIRKLVQAVHTLGRVARHESEQSAPRAQILSASSPASSSIATLLVLDQGGQFQVLRGEDARIFVRAAFRMVSNGAHEGEPDRNPALSILYSDDQSRLAVIEYYLGVRIDDDQRDALLRAHRAEDSLMAQARALIAAGFTNSQLLAEASLTAGRTAGILRTGLIGGRVPTAGEIAACQRELLTAGNS